jgi:hypothetical protein
VEVQGMLLEMYHSRLLDYLDEIHKMDKKQEN